MSGCWGRFVADIWCAVRCVCARVCPGLCLCLCLCLYLCLSASVRAPQTMGEICDTVVVLRQTLPPITELPVADN